ncbi:unnamed protein product [Orchesella dallaii]|uniref:Uncharacterized protein n=1 Tax=Orchesella dallaii TaxID=48710 RepID=A0ABP1S6G3_9HEXA
MGFLAVAVCGAVAALGLNSVTEAVPFNAVVPNLSSGWFAKPGPSESLLFGLIVLKVFAMRMAGIFPYNLNELWNEGGLLESGLNGYGLAGLNNIWRRKSRTQRDLFFAKLNKYSKAPLLKEIDAVERILLGLRRIDSHDCFIRHVCQIKQNQLAGKGSQYEDTILQIFSMKPQREVASDQSTIWDIYHDALTPEVIDCNQKYKLCPLTKRDMSVSSLLSGLF